MPETYVLDHLCPWCMTRAALQGAGLCRWCLLSVEWMRNVALWDCLDALREERIALEQGCTDPRDGGADAECGRR